MFSRKTAWEYKMSAAWEERVAYHFIMPAWQRYRLCTYVGNIFLTDYSLPPNSVYLLVCANIIKNLIKTMILIYVRAKLNSDTSFKWNFSVTDYYKIKQIASSYLFHQKNWAFLFIIEDFNFNSHRILITAKFL